MGALVSSSIKLTNERLKHRHSGFLFDKSSTSYSHSDSGGCSTSSPPPHVHVVSDSETVDASHHNASTTLVFGLQHNYEVPPLLQERTCCSACEIKTPLKSTKTKAFNDQIHDLVYCDAHSHRHGQFREVTVKDGFTQGECNTGDVCIQDEDPVALSPCTSLLRYLHGCSALICVLLFAYLILSSGCLSFVCTILTEPGRLPPQQPHYNLSTTTYLFSNRPQSSLERITSCEVCKAGVQLIQTLISVNKSVDEISKGAVNFCVHFHVQDEKVCTGLVNEFRDEVLFLLRTIPLSPEVACGFIRWNICRPGYDPFQEWNISLLDVPKPPLHPLPPPKAGMPSLRVLQLSDIHLDFQYQPGSNAECSEPLCCRLNDQPIKGKPAGKWGDYRNCDTPPALLEDLMQHLAKHEKFDYILWTGDMPGHNVWNQSRSDQLKSLHYLTDLLVKYFPDIDVFPSLGNHESAPVNSFPPPFVKGKQSISWLYDDLVRRWSLWLPQRADYNISRGGFYTAMVRPGFRLISLNTNYCNMYNWWLLMNMTDPAQELQWLIEVLQTAENRSEKVHIVGHIPPGVDDCLSSWSRNYYRIVNRYEATIMAQFYGHTHFDHIQIFYDEFNKTRPVSVAYISPSVTTFQNLNPGYRVYTVEGDYPGSVRRILDHETYIVNLTDANTSGRPKWVKEYSAKTAYDMSALQPVNWENLLQQMKTNRTTFDRFYKFYYKSHTPEGKCDEACRNYFLCEIKTARSNDSHLCKEFNVDTEGYEGFKRSKVFC